MCAELGMHASSLNIDSSFKHLLMCTRLEFLRRQSSLIWFEGPVTLTNAQIKQILMAYYCLHT